MGNLIKILSYYYMVVDYHGGIHEEVSEIL